MIQLVTNLCYIVSEDSESNPLNKIAAAYKAAGTGSDELITELYQRFGKKLYAYAIHSWKCEEDVAWDLIYQSLYKTAAGFEKYSFESEEKLAAFLFRVFINCLRNHYRDQKKATDGMTRTDLESQEVQNRPQQQAEQPAGEKMRRLKDELGKMEDWERILLLMRSDGRPYSEIATYVNKPENQLKVYYQRLKKQIADKLYEHI
jgi:RNA polymerase sigma factor (sigma-70 family)